MRIHIQAQRVGASAIIVVMLFAVTMLFAFLAINIANVQRHQAASQISVDLGSRWGVDMISRDTDHQRVEQQVRDLVARNWTVNNRLQPGWLNRNRNNIDVDVTFGSVRVADGWQFLANQSPTNAVRVNSSSTVGVAGFGSSTTKELGIAKTATSVALERDICLVVDRSGSMNFDLQTGTWSSDTSFHSYNPLSQSTSYYWRQNAYRWWWYWPHPENSRWATMIPAVHELAAELDETRQKELFSIVSYSTAFDSNIYTHGTGVNYQRYTHDAASVEQTPTFDYSAAVNYLENRYRWDHPVAGGTNISAGIDQGIAVLTGPDARPNAFKTMIVMTDGQYNQGRAPWLAAEDAAAEGIEVYTVTFSRHADRSAMEQTAEYGNGLHFHAPDGDALTEIFKTIANIPPAAYIE